MKFFNRIEDIDPRYYEECAEKGRVERIDYNNTSYKGEPMEKHAYVYLPHGYDPEQKYEVLYLIHGSQETAEKYLYQDGEENKLKRALDHLMEEKSVRPFIVVTPSEYPFHVVLPKEVEQNPFTSYFPNELCDDLIPAVEAKYHSHADYDVSAKGLIASRDYRAVMGWSMGCQTTWFVFLKRLAYFRNWGFMSCQCAAIPCDFSKEWADKTAQLIIARIKEQGFSKEDYNCYIITGTNDHTFERVALQTGPLFGYPEYFDFYGSAQNAAMLLWPGGEHHTQWRLQYTINGIKQFFHQEQEG